MRISWDSHEKMTFSWEFSNSHENLSRGFLLMRISFFSWELKAHKNLVRFSWDSHEKMTFSWAFLLVRISFFSRALKAHESLMRFSWENPLTKTLFLLFLMTVSCNSLDQDILIENVVSWVFSKVNIRCMHVVLVKENHFEVLSSSKLNMFTWVETRLCVLVHVRALVTWQRTNSVTIDLVTTFDNEAIVRIRMIVIRSFCRLRLRPFQVRF